MRNDGKLLSDVLTVMAASSLLLTIMILLAPTQADANSLRPLGCAYTECTFWYSQACNTYLCPQQREWVRYCHVVDPCFGYTGLWWREHRCDTC